MKFNSCEYGTKTSAVKNLHKVKRAIGKHTARHRRTRIEQKNAEAERHRIETQLSDKANMTLIGSTRAHFLLKQLLNLEEKSKMEQLHELKR